MFRDFDVDDDDEANEENDVKTYCSESFPSSPKVVGKRDDKEKPSEDAGEEQIVSYDGVRRPAKIRNRRGKYTHAYVPPVTGHLVPIVNGLVVNSDESSKLFDELVIKDPTKMLEDCLSVLAAFVARVDQPRQRRFKLAKRLLELFSDEDDRRKFAMRVITTNVLKQGRIVAALALDYYSNLSPYIIADALINSGNMNMLSNLLPHFSAEEYIGVVNFVAVNYQSPRVILDKLREYECFQPFHEDVDVKVASLTPMRIRQFINLVCGKTLKMTELPPETLPVFIAAAVEYATFRIADGMMEPEDFISICRHLVDSVQDRWNLVVDLLRQRNETLANYVALHVGLSKKTGVDDSFLTSCASPFNARLHTLPHCDGVVVDSTAIVQEFEECLHDSRYYAVEIKANADCETAELNIFIVTFVFHTGIFFVFPRLYSNACQAVGHVLQADKGRRCVFNRDWSSHRRFFKETFGFMPTEVRDAQAIAANELKIPSNFESLCERVTGGKLCRRGLVFADYALPSKVALQHQALRTCVVYDFIVEARSLSERRQQVIEEPVDDHFNAARHHSSDSQNQERKMENARKKPRYC